MSPCRASHSLLCPHTALWTYLCYNITFLLKYRLPYPIMNSSREESFYSFQYPKHWTQKTFNVKCKPVPTPASRDISWLWQVSLSSSSLKDPPPGRKLSHVHTNPSRCSSFLSRREPKKLKMEGQPHVLRNLVMTLVLNLICFHGERTTERPLGSRANADLGKQLQWGFRGDKGLVFA